MSIQQKTSPRRPELLCPAGDFDAMRSAVANGADAVYFGLDTFNARIRAHNFTLDELPKTMEFLHRHNVKGFVTFNILIFSDELDAAVEYIKTCARAGVDALIVQDLGACRLIKAVAPNLEIHGSTQMTLTEPRGIEFVRRLGVERVVVARELSVADIEAITRASTMPLEVFVHGALCVAYSGQCLTSESLGGRSANRGVCAQACRLPYDLIVDGVEHDLERIRYLVSPRDLAAFDQVKRLSSLGVASFKIEGRLKTPHYVAATAQVYRRAIDEAQNFSISPAETHALEMSFSRGFSPGFLDGVNHQRLVDGTFSKKRGRRLGRVVQRSHAGFTIELDENVDLDSIRPGDGIVFDEGLDEADERGGRVYVVEPRAARRVYIELGNRDASPDDVSINAIVYKTLDVELNKRLEQSFARDRIVHRVPIDATITAHAGQPLVIEITDGTHRIRVESTQLLEAARKSPTTIEMIRDPFDRLGETPFALRTFHVNLDGSPMVPKSLVADLRRDAAERLYQARQKSIEIADENPLPALRAAARGSVSNTIAPPSLHVLARTIQQVETLVELHATRPFGWLYVDFEDVRRYGRAVELARSKSVPIAVATMRIIKPGEEGWLNQILLCGPDAIIVRNLAGIGFYSEKAPHLPLIGDFSLNVANELTAQIFAEANLLRMVPSYDLSWNQLAAMISRSVPGRFECVIHQHMPMFHMEHCVFAHTLSDGSDYRTCGRPCEKHVVSLRDRYGKSHPLIPDAGCRNTLFNADAQSAADYLPRMRELGISHFRLELLRQDAGETKSIVTKYLDLVEGKANARTTLRSLRVVSQLGVTAGTLERE